MIIESISDEIPPRWAENADVVSRLLPHWDSASRATDVDVVNVAQSLSGLTICLSALLHRRWLGCRRRCSRGSRTSERPRDRSPRWRRHRTNCWRSWTLPEPGWERPATCWLPCRSARTNTHTHTGWLVGVYVYYLKHHNNTTNLKL